MRKMDEIQSRLGENKPNLPESPPSVGLRAIPEVAASVLTHGVTGAAGAMAGLASLPFVGGTRAKEIAGDISSYGYEPRSLEGKAGMAAVERVMSPISTALSLPGRAVGAVADFVSPGSGQAARDSTDVFTNAALVAAPGASAGLKFKTETGTAGRFSNAPTQEGIVGDIVAKKADDVAAAVQPKADVLSAAERQNINLNPSHYSGNQTYIELEQALKSSPQSGLMANEARAIRDIGERADKLTADLGGSADRSIFDAKVRGEFDRTITALDEKSSGLYKTVNDAIPHETVVEATAAKQYLAETLKRLGGNENLLSPAEKQLMFLLRGEPKAPKRPGPVPGESKADAIKRRIAPLPEAPKSKPLTYEALDRLRKDIGDGFKGRGVYKDENGKILNDVYWALSNDQLSTASLHGVGDTLRAAQRLVGSRKELEAQSQAVLGRDLDRSALPFVRRAASDLVKGNTSSFKKLVSSVPAPLRRDAAVAVLNDLFTAGSRSGQQVGQGFATAFTALKRNEGAMLALKRELPEAAGKTLDDLGLIAESLYRAKVRENTSGTARANHVLAALDGPGTFSKLFDAGKKLATAEGASSAAGLPGAGTAAVIVQMMLKRERTPTNVAADEFLGSPAFRQSIALAAKGDVEGANAKISTSEQFKKWAATRSPEDVKAIVQTGFIGWLTSQE